MKFGHNYHFNAYIYVILKLGLGSLKSKTIKLQLVDPSLARPYGVIKDVLVYVRTMIFPVDFDIFDIEHDPEVPFILGQKFIETCGVFINVAADTLTMRAHDKVKVFDIYKAMKLPKI